MKQVYCQICCHNVGWTPTPPLKLRTAHPKVQFAINDVDDAVCSGGRLPTLQSYPLEVRV
jgi:hypothetical protein